MKQPGSAFPLETLCLRDGAFLPDEPAAERDSSVNPVNSNHHGRIKFAIHMPLENSSVRGWKITESHIIFFGKMK